MVTPSLVLFYLAGALTIGGALGVVMTRNIVYAAFSLLAALLGVAGIFLLLFAEFLALGAGANLRRGHRHRGAVRADADADPGLRAPVGPSAVAGAAVVSLSVFALLVAGIIGTEVRVTSARQAVSFEALGDSLFVQWAVPFEVASLVLLVALIGAIVLVAERRRARLIELAHVQILGAALFCIGMYGVCQGGAPCSS